MVAFANGRFVAGIKHYYKFLLLTDRLLSTAVRRRDLRPARTAFENQLRTTPTDRTAQVALTLTDRLEEAWATATRRIERLRQNHPRSQLLTFLHGEFLLAQRRLAEAGRLLATLVSSPNARGLETLARLLLERHGATYAPAASPDDSSTASPARPPATLADEGDPAARYAQRLRAAYRLWDLQDIQAALTEFTQLMEEFPNEAEAHRAAATLHLEHDRPRQAATIKEAWESRTGQPLLPPLEEARLLIALERFSEAVDLLERFLLEEPDNEHARLMLAECLYQSGSFAQAAVYYEELHTHDPGNLGLLFRLGLCLEATGRGEEAIALFQRWLDGNPRTPAVQVELAGLFERYGRLDEAAMQWFQLSNYENPFQKQAKTELSRLTALQLELSRQRKQEEENRRIDTTADRPDRFDAGGGLSAAGGATGRPLQATDIGQLSRDQVNRWIQMLE
jgi:predicted Zn-dependent protease